MIRTIKLKIKPESYSWLNKAAIEVNQVWNWANATSIDAADRNRRADAKWLSGFDLCKLSAGATKYFEKINADCIQCICNEYAQKRFQFKKVKLKWRISKGSRKSLGWIPFKAFKSLNLKRTGNTLRFAGKNFRVFQIDKLDNIKWKDGCFAQDAVGDWWLCLPVEVIISDNPAPKEFIGIDLGLKSVATTSDGDKLNKIISFESEIAQAQRRGHKKQAKRLHRKQKRCRADALHKFSRKIVDTYQNIYVGDVSSTKLAKTHMAKSMYNASWGILKRQLEYKCQQAARNFKVVDERNTTRGCSSCGSRTGPSGLGGLVVREWQCSACGTEHDRDINSAINICLIGSRLQTSVSGNESNKDMSTE